MKYKTLLAVLMAGALAACGQKTPAPEVAAAAEPAVVVAPAAVEAPVAAPAAAAAPVVVESSAADLAIGE